MRCFRYLNFAVLICLAGTFVSCEQTEYRVHEGQTQGTFYEIKYKVTKGICYEDEIIRILKDFNASLSAYIPTSVISRVNQSDPTVVVDDLFRTVFNKSVEIHDASGGIFDITIAPIVNFWGFGFTDSKPEVNHEIIDSLMQYVGMHKIRITGDRVEKDLPGVMLDVNAIAKGFAVDVVADFLKSKGVKNLMVNIGGECVAHGKNPDGNHWRLGVLKPTDKNVDALQAVVTLNNRAMATSANTQRFVIIDGVRFSHTIDVKTGFPATHNLLSATVVADDCMTADAWATVFMAAGLEKSKQFLQKHTELEALLIYSDENGIFQTFVTNGMDVVILN